MMIVAVLLAGAQIPAGGSTAPPPTVTPTPAAIALGERLARAGTLAALLPVQAAKETDELIAARPTLSPAEQARLRRVARTTLDAGAARLFAVEGRRYAELLTIGELTTLVAAAESPAATKLRAVQPQVIAAVVGSMAGFDFKKEVATAFDAGAGRE